MRKEVIGDCMLFLGDCREVIASFPECFRVGAVVTDPPYGIGADARAHKNSGRKHGKQAAPKRDYEKSDWDSETPPVEMFDAIRRMSEFQIIFGGNFFPLPPSRCWLVWDKVNGDNYFADCELAWTNMDKPIRRLEWMWNGMLRRGGEARNSHPTQKPLGVMEWCLGHLPPVKSVLDPYMGSGTTGVACVKRKIPFIGIEREPKYFDIACSRIESASNQPDILIPDNASPTRQDDIFS